MQPFLLLCTVVALAGEAWSVPTGGRLATGEYAADSGFRPLEIDKRGLAPDRGSAIRAVSRCMWDSWSYYGEDTVKSCIEKHGVEEFQLSSEEVETQWVEICMMERGRYHRDTCERDARELFSLKNNRPPLGLRGRVSLVMGHIKSGAGALYRGATRTAGRAWSWLKSRFNRPSAFQTAVREKESLRPILVPE
ncbi:MAG: hypothetical protein M1826_000079 [Phylliscum demangeonii]|nr:MAG: hypothetical protein M1826_000079 [Phylliscum demangeonii]